MPPFDIVVKSGTVIDAMRTLRYKADVAIKDGRIVQIQARCCGSRGRARGVPRMRQAGLGPCTNAPVT